MRITPRSRDAAMPFIMLTVLIDMLAIGLIIPVLPALVGQFSDNPADQAYWYGLVAFSFGMANFLASPVLGALSDRFGRRPVLLLGFMGLGLSFFGTALTPTLWCAPWVGPCRLMQPLPMPTWPTSPSLSTVPNGLVCWAP
jgi:MFS transporter, DHA1 family, tetracycline resistance protein